MGVVGDVGNVGMEGTWGYGARSSARRRHVACYWTHMPLRHHSLIAWQRADDLLVVLHKLAGETFPKEERYALSAQLRRAAYSVAANIVEGYAREHPKERLHFLNISWGSLKHFS